MRDLIAAIRATPVAAFIGFAGAGIWVAAVVAVTIATR